MVERNIQHLSRLVDDLLDVSRISRGKVTLRKERLDLARLVRVLAKDQAAAFEAADIALRLEIPQTALWVLADVTRLIQVFGNLLGNALKFTDPGGQVSIRLAPGEENRIRLAPGEENQACFTVRDT